MEPAKLKKVAVVINSIILLLVFGHMLFFYNIDVPFLVAFSIPDACIYLIGFILIYFNKLRAYVWMVYCWVTLYTGVTTVCIGSGYGFHLYCFSLIPIFFVTEYISYKIKPRTMRAVPVGIVSAIFYILYTSYSTFYGPVFDFDQHHRTMFWSFNALIVFCFLIYFSNYLIKIIITSEEKLTQAAQIDQLTNLYNRHYMYDKLVNITDEDKQCVLAITDIDNFKHINDTYGHNAGDEVLRCVSEQISKECPDCEISRWGGEEFLIISYLPFSETITMMDNLRKKIESSHVIFDSEEIAVTITVGIASRCSGQKPNEWIQIADNRLYHGKNNGKNRIVTEIDN